MSRPWFSDGQCAYFGYGAWKFIARSVSDPDGVVVVAPLNGIGRWHRLFPTWAAASRTAGAPLPFRLISEREWREDEQRGKSARRLLEPVLS